MEGGAASTITEGASSTRMAEIRPAADATSLPQRRAGLLLDRRGVSWSSFCFRLSRRALLCADREEWMAARSDQRRSKVGRADGWVGAVDANRREPKRRRRRSDPIRIASHQLRRLRTWVGSAVPPSRSVGRTRRLRLSVRRRSLFVLACQWRWLVPCVWSLSFPPSARGGAFFFFLFLFSSSHPRHFTRAAVRRAHHQPTPRETKRHTPAGTRTNTRQPSPRRIVHLHSPPVICFALVFGRRGER